MRHAIEFARNGQIRIAYSVLSDGPTDFLYLSVYSNLDLILEIRSMRSCWGASPPTPA